MSEKTTSDEVDERQLELAKEEGEAYTRSLDYTIDEVADGGDLTTVDDYAVGLAQEEAGGCTRPPATAIWSGRNRTRRTATVTRKASG